MTQTGLHKEDTDDDAYWNAVAAFFSRVNRHYSADIRGIRVFR